MVLEEYRQGRKDNNYAKGTEVVQEVDGVNINPPDRTCHVCTDDPTRGETQSKCTRCYKDLRGRILVQTIKVSEERVKAEEEAERKAKKG